MSESKQLDMQVTDDFFTETLAQRDPAIAGVIVAETTRQQQQIELIASENIVSQAVLEAQGSVLTNKYAEGYPHKRYYGGCEEVDVAEEVAIERACKLFDCAYANVQPHSGSQANQGAMMALIKPNDTILGMSLAAGGHLTHGAKPNQSGKWFNAVQYGVREDTHLIDYDEVASLAKQHQPKLIIAGGSAYARLIDFKKFREIADNVGAYLMVDMAHIAGLVAGGVHPSPLLCADVVTSTTHKTLRGPRGGLILSNNAELGKKFNSAIFPALQGGPLMHVVAAKAVAFGEALKPDYKLYIRQIIENAKVLADTLSGHGFDIVTGGTDTHLMLVDLRSKKLGGNVAEAVLERANITCNKNGVPFDTAPPTISSGVRLGTPAGTTRGFGVVEFKKIGDLIAQMLNAATDNDGQPSEAVEKSVRAQVLKLCNDFPIY